MSRVRKALDAKFPIKVLAVVTGLDTSTARLPQRDGRIPRKTWMRIKLERADGFKYEYVRRTYASGDISIPEEFGAVIGQPFQVEMVPARVSARGDRPFVGRFVDLSFFLPSTAAFAARGKTMVVYSSNGIVTKLRRYVPIKIAAWLCGLYRADGLKTVKRYSVSNSNQWVIENTIRALRAFGIKRSQLLLDFYTFENQFEDVVDRLIECTAVARGYVGPATSNSCTALVIYSCAMFKQTMHNMTDYMFSNTTIADLAFLRGYLDGDGSLALSTAGSSIVLKGSGPEAEALQMGAKAQHLLSKIHNFSVLQETGVQCWSFNKTLTAGDIAYLWDEGFFSFSENRVKLGLGVGITHLRGYNDALQWARRQPRTCRRSQPNARAKCWLIRRPEMF